LSHHDRLNIAVFIDFDNIEIGVKTTLGQQFDVGTILDAIKERGEVVTKIAYADWTRAGEYSRTLTQHAIRLVQRNLTPGGDKNGADINLALDALEMAFTHQHINAYVIVGGDSDFLSLVEKLKQYDKKVFVVGGRAFTSMILQRNCHEFIAYENLGGYRRAAIKAGRPAAAAPSSLQQAFPIVRRALKILADREVSPQTGLLKSTLLQLDSTFSERNYGASSFLDFAEKLAQAGLITLKHAGRSVMVELNAGATEDDSAPRPATTTVEGEEPPSPVPGFGEPRPSSSASSFGEPRPPASVQSFSEPRSAATFEGGTPAPQQPTLPPLGSQEDGVKRAGAILAAATQARWPMYLRNVKQILRNADGGFDDRRYGFGGLMDLLKACQRAGLVRIERDRRGGLRVFQGTGLQGTATRPMHGVLPQPDVEDTMDAASSDGDGQPIEPPPPAQLPDDDTNESQPIVAIDTTAELLGRAAPKARSRTARSAAATTARAPRAAKTAAKPAAKRARAKKAGA
jgi:uncharacterized LabA/DUF88 family protein